ncbi:MAG: hypothetical protein L0Z07_03400 [Planctomycetes bacterium]|nr:hypothetical protein [Planctomycetota bacterium]
MSDIAPPTADIRSRPWSCGLRSIAEIALACAVALGAILPVAAAASDARHSDAVGVFQCGFDEAWDLNYDRWPDRWVRNTGVKYPHYVQIAIQADPTAVGGQCLQIDLDGASASISSPPTPVMSRFSYVLETQLKVEGLDHGEVRIAIDFYDKSDQLVQTTESEPVSNTLGWQLIRVAALEPSDPRIHRAVIRPHVERGKKPDLKARIWFDEIWLSRLPRIRVTTNNPFNVYSDLNDVTIKCELSGIPEQNPEIRFELLDASSNKLQDVRFPLNGRLIVEDTRGDAKEGGGSTPAGYEGSAEWQPDIPDYGLYHVVITMLDSALEAGQSDDERELDSRTVWLAVVPPLDMPRQGDFGWTLGEGDHLRDYQAMARLLRIAGVSWAKVPLWFEANDSERGNELIRFVELLGASNVDVVGVIDRPPPGVSIDGLAIRPDGCPAAADLFSLDPSFWSPLLDPVMTRLALRVRWWQLGRDNDTSFMGLRDLKEQISALRARLFRFGQEVQLGLAWDWESDNPASGEVTWDFQQLSTESPPTDAKFIALLAKPRDNSALRWVLVEPPRVGRNAADSTTPALEARATEFVRRLVAAKEHGADGIFIARPFNNENGVMRADGTPGELFLAWRAASAMIGGGQYLGQLQLPGGSENRIFVRSDGPVVMVVWNKNPVQESLYLGQQVQQFDIWGKAVTVEPAGKEQTIRVGPVPTYVVGLHAGITRWRMAMGFGERQIPSVFSLPHANSLKIHNFFPQGVGGSFTIVVPQEKREGQDGATADPAAGPLGFAPDRWIIEPPRGTFRLAADESIEIPFEIRLKNAMFGRQPIRVDFQVEADEPYEFSVYREMEVGTSDLALEVKTHVNQDGVLIVEQSMSNQAERLADFKCNLYARGHRRQRVQVYRLGSNVDRKIYRFPNGQELVGHEMLLEMEEVNGPRVIKYRFEATEKAATEETDAADDDSGKEPDVMPEAGDAKEVIRPSATLTQHREDGDTGGTVAKNSDR